mmetsp:Transcript_17798/g.50437  ORF Transcript_17798/g.50437 Transcript_17798/m.50437 type:complete len:236 (+) Transcript_17798:2367-3074(+)
MGEFILALRNTLAADRRVANDHLQGCHFRVPEQRRCQHVHFRANHVRECGFHLGCTVSRAVGHGDMRARYEVGVPLDGLFGMLRARFRDEDGIQEGLQISVRDVALDDRRHRRARNVNRHQLDPVANQRCRCAGHVHIAFGRNHGTGGALRQEHVARFSFRNGQRFDVFIVVLQGLAQPRFHLLDGSIGFFGTFPAEVVPVLCQPRTGQRSTRARSVPRHNTHDNHCERQSWLHP